MKKPKSKINNKDFWPTPGKPILKLADVLPFGTIFDEPCAGNGVIIRTLAERGIFCAAAHDLVPQGHGIRVGNAQTLPLTGRTIITNPPYRWDLIQPLLERWVGHAEAWLLLPWDMPCNVRFAPYAPYIDRVLPLGRVSWMDNGVGGMENSGWFRFSVQRADLFLTRT